jgi:hypothetical protein
MITAAISNTLSHQRHENEHELIAYGLPGFVTVQKTVQSYVEFLAVLQKVAASFCFRNPPKVNLDLESSAAKHRKKMRRSDGGKRHGISPSNPYGRKDKDGGNKRQFARF